MKKTHPCVTERWTGTDRRKRREGHAKSGKLIKQKAGDLYFSKGHRKFVKEKLKRYKVC